MGTSEVACWCSVRARMMPFSQSKEVSAPGVARALREKEERGFAVERSLWLTGNHKGGEKTSLTLFESNHLARRRAAVDLPSLSASAKPTAPPFTPAFLCTLPPSLEPYEPCLPAATRPARAWPGRIAYSHRRPRRRHRRHSVPPSSETSHFACGKQVLVRINYERRTARRKQSTKDPRFQYLGLVARKAGLRCSLPFCRL